MMKQQQAEAGLQLFITLINLSHLSQHVLGFRRPNLLNPTF